MDTRPVILTHNEAARVISELRGALEATVIAPYDSPEDLDYMQAGCFEEVIDDWVLKEIQGVIAKIKAAMA